jgi:hypothetical protein
MTAKLDMEDVPRVPAELGFHRDNCPEPDVAEAVIK